MTPIELAAACGEALERGVDRVSLVVPCKRPPRGRTIRLVRTDRKCPRGELANWQDGSAVAWFDAVEVLAWLIASGEVQSVHGTSQA